MSDLGDPASAAGAIVAGRYRISGDEATSAGVPFRAGVDTATGAEVWLTACASSDADSILTKAKRIATLHHPNILGVRDMVTLAGRPVVVCEAPSGADLGAWRGALGRPPTAAEFERIARQLLDAVAALHGAGVLHLRINPRAIFFESDICVRLAPFGAEADFATFSPPELAAGSSTPPGERSDVFGCAATLMALIDGRPPSNAGDLPAQVVAAGPDFHSEVLQALAIAVSPDPVDRPPSVQALAALLFEFPSAVPSVAPSVPPPRRRARSMAGGAIWAALAALAALLFGGLYALDFSPPWSEPPVRVENAADGPQHRVGEAVPAAPASPITRVEKPALSVAPTGATQSQSSPEAPLDRIAKRVAEIASTTDRDALAARSVEAAPMTEAAKARLESLGYVLVKSGAAPLWLKPGEGEVFRDCPDCPELVVVPAGSYLMGSPRDEPGRSEDEDDTPGAGGAPVPIQIPSPFALTRSEVTRGEYAVFVAATKRVAVGGCFSRRGARTLDPALFWRNPGFPQNDRHPVVCVNYDDARSYAEWLSKRAGARYRLPTEAEYEFAARSGKNMGERYFWGDDVKDLCSYANGADAAARERNPEWVVAPCRHGFVGTAPVGSFRPNGFGLYDMLGNIWEWTSDCASESLLQTTRSGPADCAGNAERILRGGSWSDPPKNLRLAARIAGPPAARDQIAGFRLVREIAR